jgi:hypothetical protein
MMGLITMVEPKENERGEIVKRGRCGITRGKASNVL